MKKIFWRYKGKLFTPLQINVKIGTIMNGILTKYKLPKITQEEDIWKKNQQWKMLSKIVSKNIPDTENIVTNLFLSKNTQEKA